MTQLQDTAEVVADLRKSGSRAISPGDDLSGSDLSKLDLSGRDLSRCNLNRASLASANLEGAILVEASLVCPVIERTVMRDVVATRLYAHAMSAVSSDWSRIKLNDSPDITGALFHGVKLVDADLSGSNFAGSTFYQCDLTDANLADAILDHAVFNECILNGARFSRAKMDGCMISRSAAQRCDLSSVIGVGLTVNRLTGNANWILAGARVPGLSVRQTDMGGTRFDGANLDRASLDQVELMASSFRGASLKQARLTGCRGSDVDFDTTDLSSALIVDCVLAHATFHAARLENTILQTSTLRAGYFGQCFGRGFTVRDSSLLGASFEGAYLYRACFTGDPVTGMILDNANFDGANLIQATIAASMRNASLVGARGAYARLNQTDLTGTDIERFTAYKASAVKTVWDDQPPLHMLAEKTSTGKVMGST